MEENPKPRRWFRFSLRTMLVLVFLFACILTYVNHSINRGQRQIKAVTVLRSETQAIIEFEDQFEEDGGLINKWVRPGPPQTAWQNYETEVVAISLKVNRKQLADDKFQAILDAISCFPNLRYLHLDCSGEFIPELFSIAISHDLRRLSLTNMNLTDEHICQIKKVEHLERLNLSQNSITGSNLALFSKMPHLEILYLSNNAIADESILELTKCESLEIVDLSGNPIQQTSINILQMKRSNLQIIKD